MPLYSTTPRHTGKYLALLLTPVILETLESVSKERQGRLERLLRVRGSALLHLLRLEHSRVIRLVDLVGREVRRIDVGGKTRLEGCGNATQAVEVDTAEEGVTLDLLSAQSTETVLCVADHATVNRLA